MKKVKLVTESDVENVVQIGTSGVVASNSKFILNNSNPTINEPNVPGGPTQYYEYSIGYSTMVNEFFTMILFGLLKFLKKGDVLFIKRGSLKLSIDVIDVFFYESYEMTVITTKMNDISDLYPFVGSSGYPYLADDVYLLMNSTVEINEHKNLLESIDFKIIPDSLNHVFSLGIDFETKQDAKSWKFRWRSVPSVYTKSTFTDASVYSEGLYRDVPSISLLSDTGNSGKMIFEASIDSVGFLEGESGGTGYSYAYAEAIGGDGTGASFSVGISGSSVISLDVIFGGYGYTSIPKISIIGDGYGASMSDVKMKMKDVSIVDQGGGYMEYPEISIDDSKVVDDHNAIIYLGFYLENSGFVDYVEITNEGSGYDGAVALVEGSSTGDDAQVELTVEKGKVKKADVVYAGSGYDDSVSVTISSSGTSGYGAQAEANSSLYSKWHYVSVDETEKNKTISGFKEGMNYEIQVLVSSGKNLEGSEIYSNSHYFSYKK